MQKIIGFVSEGMTQFNKPYNLNQGIPEKNVYSSGTITNVNSQDIVVQINLIGFQSNQQLFSMPSASTIEFRNVNIENIVIPKNSYNNGITNPSLILNFITSIDDNPSPPMIRLITSSYNPNLAIIDLSQSNLPYTVPQGYYKLDSIAFVPLTSTTVPTNNYLRITNKSGIIIGEQGLVSWQENTTTLTFQASIYQYNFKNMILTAGDVISGNGINGLRLHQISVYEVS